MKSFLPYLLLAVTLLLPYSSSAATIDAANCSYEGVQAAISSAASGDTVKVPAGSCTWASALTITKGIILQGAGAGKTLITGTVAPGSYLIKYLPANPSSDQPFRITGFSFDFNRVAFDIRITNSGTAYEQTKIRVDHNEFLNCGAPVFTIEGAVYGVVDQNNFTGDPHIDNYGRDSCNDWSDMIFSFGGQKNLYYEDNLFFTDNTATTGGHGGRYVFRYNTYTYNGSVTLTPWFDMHGNQPGGIISPRGGEIYGNKITSVFNKGITMVGHRGGQMMVFFNKAGSGFVSASSYAREEYSDDIACSGQHTMHISNSYYWNNRLNTNLVPFVLYTLTGNATGAGPKYIENSGASFNFCQSGCYAYGVNIIGGTGAGQFRQVSNITTTRINVVSDWDIIPDATSQYKIVNDCCNVLAENREFYNHNMSFDGSAGVGCGPLANRPATCTPGAGYWATDQSCASIDDASVGAFPVIPISGMLYKCASADSWSPYYTPYTYPHPIRTDCTAYPTLCDSGSTPPLECTAASDCSDQSCKNKACTGGTCVYTDVNPICPDANTVACGAAITPSNGCGSCLGTGTLCSSGSCTNGQCVVTPPSPVVGDINGNGIVDIYDLVAVASDVGKSSNLNYAKSDTNSDGIVDIFDLIVVASKLT